MGAGAGLGGAAGVEEGVGEVLQAEGRRFGADRHLLAGRGAGGAAAGDGRLVDDHRRGFG